MTDTKQYDRRHGGPFDRGGADSYYRRPFRPHYYAGHTGQGEAIIPAEGSPEWEAYQAGYRENEENGDFKDYG